MLVDSSPAATTSSQSPRANVDRGNGRGARNFDCARGSGGFSAGPATSWNDAARVKVVRDIKRPPQRQNAVSLCQ